MREVELKLELDAAQARALRRSAVVRKLSRGRPVSKQLNSTYFDTACGALRKAGIALRVRKVGQGWVQTVKKSAGPITLGLSDPVEDESPVSDASPDLSLIRDHDLREEVIGLAKPGLTPVAETRFRRTTYLLSRPTLEVELAVDTGEVCAGGRSQPICEAELELRKGKVGDLYPLAARIFTRSPVRYSQLSKSERALALSGSSDQAHAPLRKARRVMLDDQAIAESAAIAIMTENFSHALPNIARVLETDDPGGPHQLRVGLRRLRSALSVFRPVLGSDALLPWSQRAREIASAAGRLRDLDVIADGLVARTATASPDDASFLRLTEHLHRRRDTIRGDVRRALGRAEVVAFGFEFPGFLAARGWLDPSDHAQTARLAQPVHQFARKALSKRWKAARAYGDRIESLTIEERHEMRRELKKLRYATDAFRSIFEPEAVGAFIRAAKDLQTAFGALNDAAMAEMILTAPEAPGRDDPLAQRAAGRVIGYLAAESDRLWPQAILDWRKLSAIRPFWKS